jgi:hypothetical protein
VLKTNPDGAGIVQALGPRKTLASNGEATSVGSLQRFLIVTEMNEATHVVLRQVESLPMSAGGGPALRNTIVRN